MISKILAAINTYNMLSPGMRVCVCLSGGMDSCALLHGMMQLREHLQISLFACHFNHHIRGEESDRDEDFCRRICEMYNVPLFVGGADVPKVRAGSGKTMEELARDVRYAWFEEIAHLYEIDRFVLAHHMEDQAETVLFRLLRGTTPKGLGGISPVRGVYVRPLLNVSKSEIGQYVAENRILYVEDSTNNDTEYARNYIRRILIPCADKLNPNASAAISRVAEHLREDEEHLQSLLPPYEDKQSVDGLHNAVLRRVILRNFQNKSGSGLCFVHLDKITAGIRRQSDFCCELFDGWFAHYSDGFLWFRQKCKQRYQLKDEGLLRIGETYLCDKRVRVVYETKDFLSPDPKDCLFEKNVYNLSTELLLSSEQICGMIRYRVRRPGDRFLFKGHHRNIKKMMCNHKIPLEVRDMLPIFYDDAGIVGVPFIGVADRVYSRESCNATRIQIEIASDCV